ncbi:MAG TPA: putative metal-dependent hydrolase [Gemmatimonadales bacterium]|nr:putative metal-dependent hydrolase [Gemmatimonadales bacterium]
MDDPRYPIGPFTYRGPQTAEQRRERIERIAAAPAAIRRAAAGLSEAQLDTAYREGGWTVRQVIHHVPDSHLNAYTRFRLALTEPVPTIRPYFEDRWAELPDARRAPVELSLELLESLHRRWVLLLRSLDPPDWERRYLHPEHGREWTLDEALAMYAWHGEHHTAHITRLRERMGWT